MWGDKNYVRFSEHHTSEAYFPLAKCLQGNGNAVTCVSWYLHTGLGWPGRHWCKNGLRVSGGLLPLEICLKNQDQPVMRDGSSEQHPSPHSVGSAEELLIIGCCID